MTTTQSVRTILEQTQLALVIERLCYQLVEEYDDFQDACIIGIQTGGVPLARRIHSKLNEIIHDTPLLPLGKLDITFYRDDFRTSSKPLAASAMDIPYILEGKRVILVDDVLYTGRSVHAAMTALNHYGRPKSVELLVLVDRRFNRQIPIQADYFGIAVDALNEAYVRVEWLETEGTDQVLLFS